MTLSYSLNLLGKIYIFFKVSRFTSVSLSSKPTVVFQSEETSGYSGGYITQLLWSPAPLNISSVTRPSTRAVSGPVSWLLSCLLVLGGLAAALLTLLYVKTLQEKRAEQERVKSLLRLVAEQSELRPSLTSLTSFTTTLDMEDLYGSYSSGDPRDQASPGEIYHLTAA